MFVCSVCVTSLYLCINVCVLCVCVGSYVCVLVCVCLGIFIWMLEREINLLEMIHILYVEDKGACVCTYQRGGGSGRT